VLLARQHNLISCVLQGDLDGPAGSKHGPTAQHRTLGEWTESAATMRARCWRSHHAHTLHLPACTKDCIW
jgi:hypothetical protein